MAWSRDGRPIRPSGDPSVVRRARAVAFALMRCPLCGDEYQDGVTHCADCGVELLPPDATVRPRADALLGTFHPAVAERLTGLLRHRGIAHSTMPVDERVEILVDRAYRDDLRAELLVSWEGIVAGIDRELVYDILSEGGRLPGWYDPPRSTWVDRAGRMQVGGDTEDEQQAESRRVIGPSLVTVGGVLVLFGWYAGSSALAVVTGIGMVLLGLFLPR